MKDFSGKKEIKIAYIGGGSKGWAHTLMKDIALTPQLGGGLALYDINYEAAARNVKVAEAIFSHPDAKSKFRASAARNLEQALKGADFVIMSIEPGPMKMRYADLEIPRRYGIVQPVGDSTGPGGIMRGIRTVPIYADYARKIMKHCPDAWVINYTNPMSICVTSLYAAEPGIKAFGCCHEVFGTQHELAQLVKKWFKVEAPARHDISLEIAGLNHFTFAVTAKWNGIDLMPYLTQMIGAEGFFKDRTKAALKFKKNKQWFTSEKLVAFDFLRRFGVLGAAGDRHLAEFVPWYLSSEKELHRWGVILTPFTYRCEYAAMSPNSPEFYSNSKLGESGEEGARQITALLGAAQPIVTNVNIPNRGQMPGMPEGAVVETYAMFSRDSIRPIVTRPLPQALGSHVRHISTLQQITVRSAMERNKALAFQAFLADPLLRIPTDKAWKMFNEMLDYTGCAEWMK